MDTQQTNPSPEQNGRILALDVVRGFALFGIFLMNAEWFNRAMAEMRLGVPPGLSGADWWASRLVYLLVQGKFWTIFSLLFGMGFAVMLGRAEQAGRRFLPLYLRRIAGLAVFGAAHFILLWNGDILFSYALAALALLLLLYGKWKPILLSLAALAGLGFVPGLDPLWRVAGSLAYVSVAALFLRGEKRMGERWRRVPVFAFFFLVLGVVAVGTAALMWALSAGPLEARFGMSLAAAFTLAVGILAARYHQPAELRKRRLAVALYVLPFLGMTLFGVVQLAVQPSATGARAPAPVAGQSPAGVEAVRQAEKEAKRKEEAEKLRERIRAETRAHARGTYREAVAFRAGEFPRRATEEAGFAMMVISLFLLGAWFVQSGVMVRPRDHLPLFRRLALFALPVGVGLGVLGSVVATSTQPGAPPGRFMVAQGLLYLGNLPACLGYVSVVVLLLQRERAARWLAFLAPAGRMALTNYIAQAAISVVVFFGHGFGLWGMRRSWQMLYVAGVFALQVILSDWWLKRFRYGPLEWLWRAFTYWRIPPMRLHPAPVATQTPAPDDERSGA